MCWTVIPQDNIVLVNSQIIYRKVQKNTFDISFFFSFFLFLSLFSQSIYLSNLKLQNISPPKVVQYLFSSVP